MGANLSKFNGVAMIASKFLNANKSIQNNDQEKLETEIRNSFELNPAMMI